MATIHTTDDFIRLLRENPEFLAAARRELLTKELLDLPQWFSEYARRTDERLNALEHDVKEIKQDIVVIKADIVGINADIVGIKADIVDIKADVKVLQDDMTEVKSDIKSLKQGQEDLRQGQEALQQNYESLNQRQGRLETMVDSIRGHTLEIKMPRRLIGMLNAALDTRRMRIHWRAGHDFPVRRLGDEYIQAVEDAADDGIISADEETRLMQTDMVVRARKNSDGSALWVAVESSGVINLDDIERARQSAAALGRVFGEDAAPAVYGYRIAEQQREQAAAAEEGQKVLIFIDREQI